MIVPKKYASSEEIIKGSRFLSELFIISSQTDVRDKIREQKKKYSDATHVCHAFVLGKNAEVMGMSDDGEPGGTAGRPMLDVLKGRGVTNILVTVTRWFGGTLLGTGGLVRAYSGGVKSVLDAADFEELIEKACFSLSCDYQQYKVVKKIISEQPVSELSEDFSEEVSLAGKIPEAEYDAFSALVFERTNGKVCVARK